MYTEQWPPSILQSHHLYSHTTVKNPDSEKIKLKHPMEIVLIFRANHTLQLLITPVGALQRNASLFPGIESDWSNCPILCSSHTHTHTCVHALYLLPLVDGSSVVSRYRCSAWCCACDWNINYQVHIPSLPLPVCPGCTLNNNPLNLFVLKW